MREERGAGASPSSLSKGGRECSLSAESLDVEQRVNLNGASAGDSESDSPALET